MNSRLGFGVAATASLGLHLAGLAFGMSRQEVQIEAGAGATEVAVGTSFADMASGTLTAQDMAKSEPVTPTPPEQIQAAEPIRATPETPPVPVTETETVTETTARTPELISAQTATSATEAIAEVPRGVLDPIVPVEPVVVAPTPKTTEANNDPAMETLAYVETPTPAPTVSKRPLSRPASLVVPKPSPKPRKAAPAPRGNAQSNAKAGAQTKPSAATSATHGTNSTRATTQGNAAVTNYPGQVMRKINRVPKPRVTAGGSAVVRFTIAGGGGLAGLSLARSSGSAQFDKAALRVIRRAAPFPPPPPGAQRSFSLTIKGR